MNPSDRVPQTPPTDLRTECQLPCEAIQALMLEYMQHDLGEGRSDVVREHTRHCTTCRNRLTELQLTLGLLDTDDAGHAPQQLSTEHRARLTRALMHPVLDCAYVHHIFVSSVVTFLVIAALLMGLRRYKGWREGLTDPGIPVTIGEQGEVGSEQ